MKSIRLRKSLTVAMAAVALHGSPAPGADPEKTLESAIRAESQRWAEAWNRQDVKTIAELYSADAKLLPEGKDMVAGREAIFQFLKKERDATWPDVISFINIEVYGDDQQATECSELEVRDSNGVLKGRGKQILIFLKQDGKWKLHRDIWTNSAPVKP